MAKLTAHDQWWHAQSKLKEAERTAGLEKTLEELNRRNAFIRSAEGHQQDYREIVFAVPDSKLRCQIIHLNRECHRLCRASEEEEIRELHRHIKTGDENVRRTALLYALLFGACAVYVGNYISNGTGALIGAVLSLLYGFDSILRAHHASFSDVEQTKEQIREKESFLCELGTDGRFSLTEETTGQPANKIVSLL